MLNYNPSSFFSTHILGKLRYLILLSSILPVMLIGYYGYYSTTQSLHENILATDKQNVNSLVSMIQDFLDVVPNHLGFLANFHALDEFLQRHTIGDSDKTQQGLKNTTHAFYSFIVYNKIYRQLQVISPQGQELLRIDYDNLRDKTTIAPLNELHSRQYTDYFTNTINLKKGEILMTHWQRVEEKIGQEYQQVILYSTPIIDQNNVTQGILVLSLYADTVLDILREENKGLDNEHSHYQLINHTGEYLYHSFNKRERQSAHEDLLKHPALSAALADNPYGTITTNGTITTFQKIYPLHSATSSLKAFSTQRGLKGREMFWVLIKQTEKKAILTQVPQFQYVFLGVIILTVIFVLIITHWFSKTFVEPLLLVNQHLKALAQGKLIEDHIEYHKTNEMGQLVLYVWQLKNSIKNTITQANAIAAGDYSRNVILLSGQDQLGQALSNMTRTLREVTAKNVMQDWLKTGQTQLNDQMSGVQDIARLTQNIIDFLTNYLPAQIGLLYLVEEDEYYSPQNVRLSLAASYAYIRNQNSVNEFRFGEGLVGQAAKEQQSIIVTQVPEDYIQVRSGLGEAVPRNILVVPFLSETMVKGVIEIGSFSEVTEIQREFINLVAPSIGIAINTTQSHTKMQELLQQTQTQAEELQSQAEELQTQQEELRESNEELEERTRELEQQKEEIRHKNIALSKTQQVLETKAKELELASQYKSEFLANMSHELRTPLNSLLILAQLLVENKDGNLSNKQVEYARTMHSAGSDLLILINDILDLSKVEAGKIGINQEDISLAEIVETIDDKFRPIATNKSLAFHITIAQDVPPVLCTDAQRLKQIINNLLSNAFKFTTNGEIQLEVGRASSKSPPIPPFSKGELTALLSQTGNSTLKQTGDFPLSQTENWGVGGDLKFDPAKTIAISVTDTGIGIPTEKQKVIFEAFQQVDGTTSRHYGGTGLGLSISRQLARLLGGEIHLFSEEGKGSTFTLYLPENMSGTWESIRSEVRETNISMPSQMDETSQATTSLETVAQVAPCHQLKGNNTKEPVQEPAENIEKIADDREFLKPEDQSLLIIEDDRQFSNILMELAWEKNFQCLKAEDGKTGLQLAKQYHPNAIILDVELPQIDGWTVMERLKENPETRHIPVHFISAFDKSLDAKKMGAIGYLHKPVNMEQLGEAFKKIEQFIINTVKKLLVVVDNEQHQQKIVDLVGSGEIQTTLAVTLTDALQHLKTAPFDCIILDVDIEHSTCIQLLEQLRHEDDLSQIPVIIYANRDLNWQEEGLLQRCAENITIKTVRSPERLLDEVTLFLHQIEANLSTDKRDMLRIVHDKTAILKHKKVLIVDDDVRNVFALATVLEDKDMDVVIGTNGKEALNLLEEHKDIALVLMDIMMPEMDGYEAMQKIRQQPRYCKLPLIALTAKAMKNDKAKCIKAGANDYLSKPVDTDKLISLMRVWLYR